METSSPPATSVHQDDTLIYAVFCFGYFEQFLLLAYVRLGVSNFVLGSHFWHIFLSTSVLCLGFRFLAQSVLWYILSSFYALHSDSLSFKMFCMCFAVSKIESVWKELRIWILYMQLVSKINKLILAIVRDCTPCVRNLTECQDC